MTSSGAKVITTASGKRIRVPTATTPQPATTGLGSYSSRQNSQSIELTSKPLKAQGCLSAIVIAIGLVIMIAAFSGNAPNTGAAALGGILLLIGFVWATVTRIRVWWHHE